MFNERVQFDAVQTHAQGSVQFMVVQVAVAVRVEHVEDPGELLANRRSASNPEREQKLTVVQVAVVVDVEEAKETCDKLFFLMIGQVVGQQQFVVDLVYTIDGHRNLRQASKTLFFCCY